jgi:pyruvate/2-oxoglutarate/acetoin dehydrogenase E1 component
MTGAAVGAALAGMKPVVVHPRMDFMFYAFDPIINEAANWYYMNGGAASVPVVIWGSSTGEASRPRSIPRPFTPCFPMHRD